MKRILMVLIASVTLVACDKKKDETPGQCNMDDVYEENASKSTISDGVWGTISEMSGDCMPGASEANWGCSHCPVKRTIRFYEYTRKTDAVPFGNSGVFYESFSTQLIAETESDEDGFFEVDLLPGQYTVVVIEQGKLHASGTDGLGGISPVTINAGKNKLNFTMTYRAAF